MTWGLLQVHGILEHLPFVHLTWKLQVARKYLFGMSVMGYMLVSTLNGIFNSTKILNIWYVSTLSGVHLNRFAMTN